MKTDMFIEVLGEQENNVEVLCLLSHNPQILETRTFSKTFFERILEEGYQYGILTIETIPGSMSIKIEGIKDDLSAIFKKEDHFKKFEGTPFSGK